METTPTLVECHMSDDVLILQYNAEEIRTSDVAYAIRDQAIAIVDQTTPKRIVVDLSRVAFISSLGLLALMNVQRHTPEAKIILCGMTETVYDVFESCRLINNDNVKGTFATAETPEQAVAMLD